MVSNDHQLLMGCCRLTLFHHHVVEFKEHAKCLGCNKKYFNSGGVFKAVICVCIFSAKKDV